MKLHLGQSAEDGFRRVRNRLFAYDIFPSRFMRFILCPPGPITEGNLIVQRAGPRWLSLESAVRVIEAWNRSSQNGRLAGFRYATLAGHPEQGWASFEVRLLDGKQVEVVLEARSRAGTFLTKIGRPLVRATQLMATKAALRRLTQQS